MSISIEKKNTLIRIFVITLGGAIGGLLIINLKSNLLEDYSFPLNHLPIIAFFLALGYAIFGEVTKKKKVTVKIVGKSLGSLSFFFIGLLILLLYTIATHYFIDGLLFTLDLLSMFAAICIPISIGLSIGEELIKSKNILVKIISQIGFGGILSGILITPIWHVNGYLVGGCIGSGIAFGSAVAHLVWRQ